MQDLFVGCIKMVDQLLYATNGKTANCKTPATWELNHAEQNTCSSRSSMGARVLYLYLYICVLPPSISGERETTVRAFQGPGTSIFHLRHKVWTIVCPLLDSVNYYYYDDDDEDDVPVLFSLTPRLLNGLSLQQSASNQSRKIPTITNYVLWFVRFEGTSMEDIGEAILSARYAYSSIPFHPIHALP